MSQTSYSLLLSVTLVAFHLISFIAATHHGSIEEPEFDWMMDSAERLRSHFALDHRKAMKLATLEESIFLSIKTAKSKVASENWNAAVAGSIAYACSRSLNMYLKEFEKDSSYMGGISGSPRANTVAENPLLLFRMIRRIVVILKVEMAACENHSDILQAIENMLQIAGISLPTNDDLEDALLGIIRIHFVYGFNARTQLRLGILQNVHTNVSLNFDDCLELGRRATEMGATVLAYQWLSSANLSLAEDNDMDNIDKEEASTRIKIAWEDLLAKTKLVRIGQLQKVLEKQTHQELLKLTATDTLHYDYYATCRGESELSELEKAKLTCILGGGNINPYWSLQPLKIEQLHFDPPVLQFHDFIGNQFSSYIEQSTSEMFERSNTISISGNHVEYSIYRTSMTTWIYDDDDSFNPPKELKNLNRRIELCTGFHVMKEGSSQALQVVDYSSLGGHYDFHDDAMETETLTKRDGDRLATFFIFLNDVPLGGYTGFPHLKIFARPIKGSAISWFNLYRNGIIDRRHLHGGCPVILGSKTAANKWILAHENTFQHKCSLNPTQ